MGPYNHKWGDFRAILWPNLVLFNQGFLIPIDSVQRAVKTQLFDPLYIQGDFRGNLGFSLE